MSRLAWELRPIVLDDLGLEPAIRRFVEDGPTDRTCGSIFISH